MQLTARISLLSRPKILLVILLMVAVASLLVASLSVLVSPMIVAGILVAGLVLIVLMRRPILGIYLTFGASLLYMPIIVGGIDISPGRSVGLVAVFVFAAVLLSNQQAVPGLFRRIWSDSIAQGMIILLVAAVLSFSIGGVKFFEATHSPLLKYQPSVFLIQLISYVALYFATIHLVNSLEKLTFLLRIVTIAAALTVVYAAYKVVSGGSYVYFLEPIGSIQIRVRVAQWYSMLLPFVLAWLFSKQTAVVHKLWLTVVGGLFVVGLLLSATRAAYISLLLQSVVYIFFYPRIFGFKRAKFIPVIILLLPLSILIFANVSSYMVDVNFRRIYRLLAIGDNFQEGAADPRLQGYLNMLKIYIQDLNWLTGIGVGRFEAVYHYHYFASPEVMGQLWLDAHSIFITLPLEMGLLGVVVLVLFFFGFLRQLGLAFRRAVNSHNQRLAEMSIAHIASCLAILPSITFQGGSLLDRNFYFVAATASIIWALSSRDFTSFENKRRHRAEI